MGREQCARLAERFRPYKPVRIVTSEEPKAFETGKLLGVALGLEVDRRQGLHEHDRSGVPYFEDPATLRALIREFFARPSEAILGRETADTARERFRVALDDVIGGASTDGPVLVVAHGTVISLLVAAFNEIHGFAFWDELELGDCVLLTTPGLRLVGVIGLNKFT